MARLTTFGPITVPSSSLGHPPVAADGPDRDGVHRSGEAVAEWRRRIVQRQLRDQHLSLQWFRNRADAKVSIEAWRRHYNEVRPHSSLGYLTPAEFKAKHLAGSIDGGRSPARSAARWQRSSSREKSGCAMERFACLSRMSGSFVSRCDDHSSDPLDATTRVHGLVPDEKSAFSSLPYRRASPSAIGKSSPGAFASTTSTGNPAMTTM